MPKVRGGRELDAPHSCEFSDFGFGGATTSSNRANKSRLWRRKRRRDSLRAPPHPFLSRPPARSLARSAVCHCRQWNSNFFITFIGGAAAAAETSFPVQHARRIGTHWECLHCRGTPCTGPGTRKFPICLKAPCLSITSDIRIIIF